MVEQRYPGVEQVRLARFAHGFDGILQRVAAGRIIGSVHAQHANSLKPCGVFRCVLGAGLCGVRGNVPAVVLHHKQQRKLLEGRHLQGFRHLALGHGRVANGTNRNGLGRCFFRRKEPHQLLVLEAHGRASGGNGLHSGGAGLVGDLGLVRVVQRRVAVVGAPAGEGVVPLGQELEHEVVGRHSNGEQQGVVPVVRVHKIMGREQLSQGNLYGFVAAGCGVHVGRRYLAVGFVQLRHGLGRD